MDRGDAGVVMGGEEGDGDRVSTVAELSVHDIASMASPTTIEDDLCLIPRSLHRARPRGSQGQRAFPRPSLSVPP